MNPEKFHAKPSTPIQKYVSEEVVAKLEEILGRPIMGLTILALSNDDPNDPNAFKVVSAGMLKQCDCPQKEEHSVEIVRILAESMVDGATKLLADADPAFATIVKALPQLIGLTRPGGERGN